MNKKLLYGLAALMAGTGLYAQDNAAIQKEIAEAREVIAQYVKTRQEIARVQNEWKAYQELTNRRIDLYNAEIETLRKQIEAAEQDTTQAERTIAGIKDEIAELRKADAIVAEALPTMEDKIRLLSQYFPDPLKDKTKVLMSQLTNRRTQASTRLAVLMGVLSEVDKFNTEFFYTSVQKKLPSGETKLVDVVYLGLAIAYYADKEGQIGGYGVPAANGWKWIERNDIAPAVRDAVLYYNGDIKPAMLVDLPLEIQSITLGN